MGQQAMRAMSYDRAANERNAIQALRLAQSSLQWHRLDDGVMGGQSATAHLLDAVTGHLLFKGFINTQGGGFTSIRTPLPEPLSASATAISLRLKGDGKTYKLLLSQGRGSGGPMASQPSWQADLPTTGDWQDVTVPFDSLLPNFGGRREQPKKEDYTFKAENMKELGLMLSLKLSDGSANPPETFGEGLFDFELEVESINILE